jgi:glycosyltransferase involved in cell wall biosynthesis
MPRSSIIIATHSRPQLLPRAVESARAAGVDVEVIVVDDASMDETADVCRALKGIKYLRVDRNQGVAGARNIGLVASQGEYISFLDDDDTRLPGSLDLQIDLLAQNPDAALVYGRALYADHEGQVSDELYPIDCPQGDIFWELLTHNFIPCGSAVFRRSAIVSLGLLDDTIPGLDDWDLWIRIAELYPVVAVEPPVVTWRRSDVRSAQGTSDAAAIVSQSIRKFKKDWMKLPRAAAASRDLKRATWRRFSENMLEHALWQSARAVASGKPLRPLKNLTVAPQLDPAAIVRIAKHRITRSRAKL